MVLRWFVDRLYSVKSIVKRGLTKSRYLLPITKRFGDKAESEEWLHARADTLV
jgi:hypothetical protein